MDLHNSVVPQLLSPGAYDSNVQLCSSSLFVQVLLNHKRRSVSGLSPEFLYLNVLGFACYAVSPINRAYVVIS